MHKAKDGDFAQKKISLVRKVVGIYKNVFYKIAFRELIITLSFL